MLNHKLLKKINAANNNGFSINQLKINKNHKNSNIEIDLAGELLYRRQVGKYKQIKSHILSQTNNSKKQSNLS